MMSTTRRLQVATATLVLVLTVTGVPLLAQRGAVLAIPQADGQAKVVTPAKNMRVVEVKPGKFRATVLGPGVVEPARTYDVFNKVEGQSKIVFLVPDGTSVKKGELVCELDSTPLTNELANLADAATGGAPDSEKARLVRVQNLRRMIANCKMYAPADGVVIHANDGTWPFWPPQIEKGGTVRERQKIFHIPDLRDLVVRMKVDKSEVGRVAQGQPARLRVQTLPVVYLTGVVDWVNKLPDPKNWNSRLDVVEHSTAVRITNPPQSLQPGLVADVELLTNELENVIAVPPAAVVSRDGKDYVAVMGPACGFELREVVLGLSDRMMIEVKQGLKSGETVARNPWVLLKDEEAAEKKTSRPTRPAKQR